MQSPVNLNIGKILESLAGRIFLIILTVMVTAAGLMLVYLINLDRRFIFVTLLVQAGLGIVSGLITRLLLGDHIRVLKLLVALVAMIAGQGVLGIISMGVLGLPLFQERSFVGLNWYRLVQFIWCGTVTFLFTMAWVRGIHFKRNNGKQSAHREQIRKSRINAEYNQRKSKNLSQKPSSVSTRSRNPKLTNFQITKNEESRLRVINVRSQFNQTNHGVPSSQGKQQMHLGQKKLPTILACQKGWLYTYTHRISEGKTLATLRVEGIKWIRRLKTYFSSVLRTGRMVKNNKRRVKFLGRRINNLRESKITINRTLTTVKLVGEEKHICPYCLEEVTRSDYRGLKKCPICKTWHHADCWAEVGECQVPHYQ